LSASYVIQQQQQQQLLIASSQQQQEELVEGVSIPCYMTAEK
jgi:hypothetical protein